MILKLIGLFVVLGYLAYLQYRLYDMFWYYKIDLNIFYSVMIIFGLLNASITFIILTLIF